MSKLEELLKELCPDGVEYVRLNKICKIYDGTHQTPTYTASGVKFVSVENINSLYDTQKYISEEDFKKYKIKPQIDDVFMTRIGSIGVCTVVERSEPLAYYVSLALLRPDTQKASSKFLKYVIESLQGRKELRKRTLVNAVPIKINKDDIGKITIPVPPLPVQNEIVRILDNFTELTAELKTQLATELTARKKQYEYYREQLILSSTNSVVKLDEIVDIYLGLTATPTYTDEGVTFISAQNTSSDYLDLSNVKYISRNDFKKATSNAKPRRGDVLFTRVGSNLGHPVIVETDEELCIFVSLGYLRVKNDAVVLNSFLKHWMNTDLFWSQVRKNVHGAAKVNLNTGWLKKFDIILPTIEQQQKIIQILNEFEILCNDISTGLPAEIAARTKQYEYYRDKLLTFPERA